MVCKKNMQNSDSAKCSSATCKTGPITFVCASFDAFIWLFNVAVLWWLVPQMTENLQRGGIQIPPMAHFFLQWHVSLSGLFAVFSLAALVREVVALPKNDKNKISWFSMALALGVVGVMAMAFLLMPGVK